MERVRRTRLIGGGILVATGLVWIGQGTGLIRSGSFMTGDPFWTWLGLAAVIVGVGFIAWTWRPRT
jgi:dipeptide/tripeptide permease